MKILAIDSTAKVCTAALCDDRELVTLKKKDAGMTHSELLLPMIEEILTENSLSVSDIDVFALSRGPGSFTGVRIGAATVKGLAFARGKKCIGVSTLEALAYNYRDGEGIAVCAMDARRGQVYSALFRLSGGAVERITEDDAVSVESLCEMCGKYAQEKLYLCGDGAHLVYSKLSQDTALGIIYDEQRALEDAYSVALCAYEAYLRGEGESDSELRPSYLRLAQAERERLERLANNENK